MFLVWRILFRRAFYRKVAHNGIARTSGLFIDTPHNFTSAPLDDKYVLVKAAVAAFQGML